MGLAVTLLGNYYKLSFKSFFKISSANPFLITQSKISPHPILHFFDLCIMFPLTLVFPRSKILDRSDAGALYVRWFQVGQWDMGEWDREGEKANAGCGDQQVIAVGKWDWVLLGISGRLWTCLGYSLEYIWSIRKLGVYPPLLISPWLRDVVGGWDF